MLALTEKTYFNYCAFAYANYNCSDEDEFYEDMERIKYIKKLFTTYRKKGEVKEQLILNHFVVLYNVFNPTALTQILLFRFEKDMDLLAPFLNVIGRLPENISMNIADQKLVEKLKRSKVEQNV